jgi:hypothetical protein
MLSTTTGPSLAAAVGALERLWPGLSVQERAGLIQYLDPGGEPEPAASTAVELALRFLRLPGIEGCKLEAYPDPETRGEPWTIGWGNTRIDGRPVRRGDRITQAQADELLRETVAALETVLAEEGRPPESVFDFVQGITAVARSKPQQDARLVMEGKAKVLLERAL